MYSSAEDQAQEIQHTGIPIFNSKCSINAVQNLWKIIGLIADFWSCQLIVSSCKLNFFNGLTICVHFILLLKAYCCQLEYLLTVNLFHSYLPNTNRKWKHLLIDTLHISQWDPSRHHHKCQRIQKQPIALSSDIFPFYLPPKKESACIVVHSNPWQGEFIFLGGK